MFWTKTIRTSLEGEALMSKEKATRFKRLLSPAFLPLHNILVIQYYLVVHQKTTVDSDSSASQVLLAPFLVCWQETHDWLHTNEIQVSNFPSTSLVPVECFHPIELAPMYNSLFHIQMVRRKYTQKVF